MSQTFSIPTSEATSISQLRANFNLAFQSLQSSFSGTSAPSNPVAGQFWYNTDGNVLKVYNGTDWITTLGGVRKVSFVFSTDSPYTVADDDHLVVVNAFTDDVTVNLPASQGEGRDLIIVKTDNVNDLTVDADGTEGIGFSGTITVTNPCGFFLVDHGMQANCEWSIASAYGYNNGPLDVNGELTATEVSTATLNDADGNEVATLSGGDFNFSNTVNVGNANFSGTVQFFTGADVTGALEAGTVTTADVTTDNLFLTAQTVTQITSDRHNWAGVGQVFNRISSDASRTITGILAANNNFIYLINVGSQNIVLADQNAGSSDANKIISQSGNDVTLAPDAVACLWYDLTTTRWRILFPAA